MSEPSASVVTPSQHVLTAAALATWLVQRCTTPSGARTPRGVSFTGIRSVTARDTCGDDDDDGGVTLLHWDLSRSMGAAPRQLPVCGDRLTLTPHDDAGALVVTATTTTPSTRLLLHRQRRRSVVALLRVRADAAATRVVRVNAGYGFVADLAPQPPPSPAHFFDVLQGRLVRWVLHAFAHDPHHRRTLSLTELERAFPALLALNPARRRRLVEAAVTRYAREELRHFDGTLVRIRDTPFFLCVDDAVKRDCPSHRANQRGLAAFELALVNAVLLTDLRLDALLPALALCLRRMRVVCSIGLAHCVAIVVQLLHPLAFVTGGTGLTASVRDTLLGNLFALLQDDAAAVRRLLLAHPSTNTTCNLEHAVTHRRGPYRNADVVDPNAAPLYEPSAFFAASVLPETTTTTQAGLMVYAGSLKSAPLTADAASRPRRRDVDATLSEIFDRLALRECGTSTDDVLCPDNFPDMAADADDAAGAALRLVLGRRRPSPGPTSEVGWDSDSEDVSESDGSERRGRRRGRGRGRGRPRRH